MFFSKFKLGLEHLYGFEQASARAQAFFCAFEQAPARARNFFLCSQPPAEQHAQLGSALRLGH